MFLEFSLGDRKCLFEDISHGNVAPENVTRVFKMQISGFTFQMCDLLDVSKFHLETFWEIFDKQSVFGIFQTRSGI